jgi:hypothetical protein
MEEELEKEGEHESGRERAGEGTRVAGEREERKPFCPILSLSHSLNHSLTLRTWRDKRPQRGRIEEGWREPGRKRE